MRSNRASNIFSKLSLLQAQPSCFIIAFFIFCTDSRDISNLVEACGLTFGHVGNPSYFYEIDFVNKHVKVWDSRISWVNAPIDWKERGWNCWIGKNNKYGYSNWVKGKKIYDKSLKELVKDVEDFKVELNEGVIAFAENIG